MRRNKWLLAWALLVCVPAAILLWGIHEHQWLPIDRDEGGHLRDAQTFLQHLAPGNHNSLGAWLTRPQWYPPLASVLLGLWMGAVGDSVWVARSFSLLLALALSAVLASRTGKLRGVGSWFAAVAPLAHVATQEASCLVMLELPGLLAIALALWAFERSEESQRPQSILVAGAAGFLTFWTRYDYGVVLAAALLIHSTLRVLQLLGTGTLRVSERLRAAARCVAPGVVMAVLIGAWLFAYGQWRWFWAYAHAQPTPDKFDMGVLLYFPRWLVTAGGVPTALLLSAWTLVALQSLRRHRWRPSITSILFFVGLGMLAYKMQTEDRFGVLLLVPIWIAGGRALSETMLSLDVSRDGSTRGTTVALGVAVAACAVLAFPSQKDWARFYEGGDSTTSRALASAAERLGCGNGRREVLLQGHSDQRNSRALEYFLNRQCRLTGASGSYRVWDGSDLKLGWPRGTEDPSQARRRTERLKREAYAILDFGGGEARGFRREAVSADGHRLAWLLTRDGG